MKVPAVRFKNLTLALADLRQFIVAPQHLATGKPIARFGDMRPRELVANWLLCVAVNAAHGNDDLTFSSDPDGGDGFIVNTTTDETWPTEHVLVPPALGKAHGDAEQLILAAIQQKNTKGGAAYARGKTLVVFLDAQAGVWYANRVAQRLPVPMHFATVWVVALQTVQDGVYRYAVTNLDVTEGDAPTFVVSIALDFATWSVERRQ
ncbi:MAG: hypothetical protein EON59_07575 [Alphaproteobacteria bacterium]|nr:MAG: hypothetical protein EON59_07575 [Alphaproteobacteria bacterium]